MRNSAIISLVASCVLASAVVGQEKGPPNEARARNARKEAETIKYETIVYPVRSVPVPTLTTALADFLKDSSTRITVEPNRSVLLIRVEPVNRVAVLDLLDKLDRPPRAISVQLHLLKTGGKNLEDADTESFTGPTGDVLNKVAEMQRAGRIYLANQVDFTAIENQETKVQLSKRVAFVTFTTTTRTGERANTYRFEEVGTQISLTANTSEDGGITILLQLQRSEIEKAEKQDDDTGRVAPPGTSMMTLQTTVRMRDGHSVLVSALVSHSGRKSGEAYLIVSAKLREAGANGGAVSFRAYSESEVAGHVLGASSRRSRHFSSAGRDAALRDRTAAVERYAKAVIAKYDKDGDGVLTKDEWEKSSRDPSAADGDGDGKITVAEYAQWILKRRSSDTPP